MGEGGAVTNQVLLVPDSLRWDVFKRARAPFLKSLGTWKKAWTPGNYTLPAHVSFFSGKLPQTRDRSEYYDTAATRVSGGRRLPATRRQLWRLDNPESVKPASYVLQGRSVIEGFARLGYRTLCSGAVNWFNPELPASKALTEHFDECRFFGPISAEQQCEWALERVADAALLGQPYFLFLNFGETHHPFRFKGCAWESGPDPYGNRRECLRRQAACVSYLDGIIGGLLSRLGNFELVICSDHGEAMGEKGLWGHSFYHKRVMEVPVIIRRGIDRLVVPGA